MTFIGFVDFSKMRFFVACLLVALAIPATLGSNKLFVKFAPPGRDPQRQASFFPLPRSLNKLSPADGYWNIVEIRDGGLVSVACRNGDYRICLLVDRKNSVAGIQISIAAADLQKNHAPIKPQLLRKTVLGTEVYSTDIFFVEQNVLAAGGREMTEATATAPNGFFVKNGNAGLRHIPLTEEEMKPTKFRRQSCFPNMGRHYFYDVRKDLDCNVLDSYCALYEEQTQKLVGTCITLYGAPSAMPEGRQWFETLTVEAAKYIVPDGPDCLVDYINKYGMSSIHIYTNDEPWKLTC